MDIPKKLMFVCTGNTCRSPIAEVLARNIIEEILNIPPDKLIKTGYSVSSAGIDVQEVSPATEHAITVMGERGIDLSFHRSRQITDELLTNADVVWTMSPRHLQYIKVHFPDQVVKASLLRIDGGEIADPFEEDLDTYHRTATQLDELIHKRLGRKGGELWKKKLLQKGRFLS